MPKSEASPPPQSPVMPNLLDGSKRIHFRCHKGIACFNACCKSIDISLTPYDILRLKKRLGLTSSEFLQAYTVPYEMEKDGLAGVKFKPVEGGTACRYYPVALLSMRKQDEYEDTRSCALVKEDHCLGHNDSREISIDEQGLGDTTNWPGAGAN